MVAMAGKYIVFIERSKLILTHPAGVSFELTREDAMELAVLVRNWQRALGMGLYEQEMEEEQVTESSEVVAMPMQVSESLQYES